MSVGKWVKKFSWAYALWCYTCPAFLTLLKNSWYFFLVLEDRGFVFSVAISSFNLKPVSFFL